MDVVCPVLLLPHNLGLRMFLFIYVFPHICVSHTHEHILSLPLSLSTWILSSSLLLACSSFFCRVSSSRACCCSFCSHLMYSTEALRMVPLFQRISLPEKGKDNLFHTSSASAKPSHTQEKCPYKEPLFL